MPHSLESLRQACAAPLDHPSSESIHAAGAAVMDAMIADFVSLSNGAMGETGTRETLDRLLKEPVPEHGCDFAKVLAEFQQKVLGYSFRPSHPRFLAFIPGAPSWASILGDCLASNANLFAGVWKEAAGAAEVELVVLDWFKQLLGYPQESLGIVTGGGSEANLTALVVARDQVPYEQRDKLVLYASVHRHWSVDRAVKIIGMRPEQVRPLACDHDYRLRMDALQEAIAADVRAGRRPWLVLANAGTTNTGSVDPLAPLADCCAQHGLWFHVDAAYGWPLVLIPEGRELMTGIERADSITLDPHKWFAQPFGAGCVLVRKGKLLGQTFMMRPEYMQDVVPREDEVNFCDHGIALTRRLRALKIWFSIKLLGLGWFRRLIAHDIALTDYAEALIRSTGRFEITSGRKLGIVCFSYVPRKPLDDKRVEALQLAIADELMRGGRAFLSTTRLHGKSTLRLCFVNWRTTAADVDEVVGLLQQIGEGLESTVFV